MRSDLRRKLFGAQVISLGEVHHQANFSRLDAILVRLAALPGNRFEDLRGDRKGQYSILITDQWRICFAWPNQAPGPSKVKIVDYHLPTNRITQILNGTRGVRGDTALRLAHFLGTSAEFWLSLPTLHDLRLAQE